MENEVTNKDLDVSLLGIVNEHKRLEKEKIMEQDKIAKERLRNLKIYKSKAHKRRKKLIKIAVIGTLVVAASFGIGKKIHTMVTEADVMYYEIQYGDTLEGIANRFHVPIEEIRRDNGSRIGAGDLIRTGDVIAFITSPKLVEEYKETHDIAENKEEWVSRSRKN